ncbi:MAG: bacilysin biosynthesis oxidoreductase BacC [Acidiferrobacteraceae bacterium]|mgnify:FL=1|jgi:NAD(P)-dependent dehydrogenase (short-subunit alcohol dehydrogenase family)|nr:bacilysin biosynthesis oxidoreductase BacC [Acidiferrobacteraceae bacterium]|tara:strand:- start:136 stop:894 length:759 start_codon:yes stop_codon:yes gene_type:complete
MDFSGKRILVTGSSRGIGRATARVFLDAGARVAINGRSRQATDTCIETLGPGTAVVAVPGDVSEVAGCEAVVNRAIDLLGGLDVLVNSAGVAFFETIEDSDEAIWNATINTNLKGTYFCIRAALPALRADHGNVVNVASDAGLQGETGLTAYCASKGGVVNLTRALAMELAPAVRVNCVCPGYVDTDMVRRDGIDKTEDPAAEERRLINLAPLKRFAQPEEIGQAIAYLASAKAINVTGTALQIDGGSTAGQ